METAALRPPAVRAFLCRRLGAVQLAAFEARVSKVVLAVGDHGPQGLAAHPAESENDRLCIGDGLQGHLDRSWRQEGELVAHAGLATADLDPRLGQRKARVWVEKLVTTDPLAPDFGDRGGRNLILRARSACRPSGRQPPRARRCARS